MKTLSQVLCIFLIFSIFSTNLACQTEWNPVPNPYKNYPKIEESSQTQTNVQQFQIQNDQSEKAEIKKREFPQDFNELLRMWQAMQGFQTRNYQNSPNYQNYQNNVAETQSNEIIIRPSSPSSIYENPHSNGNTNRRRVMNQGWDSTPAKTITDSWTDKGDPKIDEPNYPGPGHMCSLKPDKTNENRLYFSCEDGLNPEDMTIKETHDLWLKTPGEMRDVDIKVPNYKIKENIFAHFKESPIKQKINVWVKKPDLMAEVATQKPKIVSMTEVKVNFEKPPPPRQTHYSEEGENPSLRYSQTTPRIIPYRNPYGNLQNFLKNSSKLFN